MGQCQWWCPHKAMSFVGAPYLVAAASRENGSYRAPRPPPRPRDLHWRSRSQFDTADGGWQLSVYRSLHVDGGSRLLCRSYSMPCEQGKDLPGRRTYAHELVGADIGLDTPHKNRSNGRLVLHSCGPIRCQSIDILDWRFQPCCL